MNLASALFNATSQTGDNRRPDNIASRSSRPDGIVCTFVVAMTIKSSDARLLPRPDCGLHAPNLVPHAISGSVGLR